MKTELDRVADALQRQARQLAPMQVAGGSLTAVQMRRLVGVLELNAAQARQVARRVGELLALIEQLGDRPPPVPPKPGLRLIRGGAPDDGPSAA